MMHKEKVTPLNMEESGNTSKARLSLTEIFHQFAAETTAHGIPRIIDRRKPLAKFFWLCVVVGAFVVFFVQTKTLLSNYYAFNTQINLINSEEVFFPAVTVCNLNKMRKSKLISALLEPPQKEETTIAPQDEDDAILRQRRDTDKREQFANYEYWYYESNVVMDTDGGNAAFSVGEGYVSETSAPLQNPTREELENFGHKGEDFILECTFNKRPCNYTHFIKLQNDEYGNCFTFNGKSNESYPRVTKIGSNFGLHLTLNIELNEYVGWFADAAGVRLVIHPSDILPHPEDVGLSVSPGLTTNIGIRQVEISRLPEPHGECTDGTGHKYLQNDSFSYSIISCQKRCLLDAMASKCDCVTNIYDDYAERRFCKGKDDRRCRQSIERAFYLNELGCHCPAQCHEFVYNMQTTSAIWPSKQYYELLKDILRMREPQSPEIWEDVQTARNNLVRLKIYFQELNYELVKQVPANTIESVLGTTGGLLGLYIGFSVITISEIFVLIYDVFVFLLKNKKAHF